MNLSDQMKIVPTEQEAEVLSDEMEKPCQIPLISMKEGYENPAEIYLSIRKKFGSSYLLESLGRSREESRYSVIGCQPLLHLKIQNGTSKISGLPGLVEISQKSMERTKKEDTDALEILRRAMLFEEMKLLPLNLPPCTLGVTGYVSYDFVRQSISLPSKAKDDLHHPTLEFILPNLIIVFDHQERKTFYASFMFLAEGNDFCKAYSKSLEDLKNLLLLVNPHSDNLNKEKQNPVSVSSNMSKDEFEAKVRRIKEYIQMGDVNQVVLSRRIDLIPAPDLGKFYNVLRRINPSPYMFFLDFPERSIVGSSPEVLLRLQNRRILTRPIGGTRRRGRNEKDDLAMERDLLRNKKERAEHIMLVDQGQSDIERVSKSGTLKIPEFMKVEKYGNVQHLVSTVTGELEDEVDAFKALRALFPIGTVTGTPKIRAMEIIEELEPTRRGIYSGAIGSFNYTGDADFAIAIRTLTAGEERAQIQVGAGIVADSAPEKEFFETENKARSLLRAAGVQSE